MKLSTPEEMEGIDVSEHTDTEKPENVTSEMVVELETGEESVSEAVRLNREMLARPEAFGIAPNQKVRDLRQEVADLRELVVEQREAIAELSEAVEHLGGVQGRLCDHSGPSVILDGDRLGDIYDPTEEFDGA